MADASVWAGRVTAWRTSGKTSEDFCRGREFTPGGLRFWAHRLGKASPARDSDAARRKTGPGGTPRKVRLARVVRLASSPPAACPAPIVVEIGVARVVVPTGADGAALAMVLAALGTAGGAR